jgi:hypothetical protein
VESLPTGILEDVVGGGEHGVHGPGGGMGGLELWV